VFEKRRSLLKKEDSLKKKIAFLKKKIAFLKKKIAFFITTKRRFHVPVSRRMLLNGISLS
jgi:hypothetical protein